MFQYTTSPISELGGSQKYAGDGYSRIGIGFADPEKKRSGDHGFQELKDETYRANLWNRSSLECRRGNQIIVPVAGSSRPSVLPAPLSRS